MSDWERISTQPVTRFAPSPTGRLHLGHVANAVWTWGIAAARQGHVILRIEDHDRGRCRPEFEAAIYQDLDWLGLVPQSESTHSLTNRPSPFRQSDNHQRYADALTELEERGLVYHCGCSRRKVADTVGPVAAGRERRYPGTCRTAGLGPGPGRGIRVTLPAHDVEFDDLRHGKIRHTPADQCGDLLVRDGVGNWTYQWCVVLDDLAHGIDLVIRGDDLLELTGRQLMLAALLGRATLPRYLHHPLILAPSGAKLSKRDGAPGLDELRRAGHSAAEVLGRAAYATGVIPAPRPLEASELGEIFS